MRVLLMLPLTFLAGVDGFGWFVPYLVLIGAAVGVVRFVKADRRRSSQSR